MIWTLYVLITLILEGCMQNLRSLWPPGTERNEVKVPASTVLEAENPRSPKVVDMGIYDQLLTSWVQNDQNLQNWTKVEEVLLHKQWLFSGSQKSWSDYEVKIGELRSNLVGYGHFGLRGSRADHRYPYRPLLVTSDFRPPVLLRLELWPRFALSLEVTVTPKFVCKFI